MKKSSLILLAFFFLGVSDTYAYQNFICRSTAFKDVIDLNKEKDNGQCVKYVRHETEISYRGCNGEAWTCYDKAQQAGYAVGQEPRVGAIIVFDKDPSKIGLGVGHVGIVKAINDNTITIRDSNWIKLYTVGEHDIDVSKFKIIGYIYCDGSTLESPPNMKITIVK